MKTKSLICTILCALVLVACETITIPDGYDTLREQIVGEWNIQTYILSGNLRRQEPIPISHQEKSTIFFDSIHNDTCLVNLTYANIMYTRCLVRDNNQIEFLREWGGTQLYDPTGNENKLLEALNCVQRGFVRNDSLFLLIDQFELHLN